MPTDPWNASASDPHHAKGILKVIMEKNGYFCARFLRWCRSVVRPCGPGSSQALRLGYSTPLARRAAMRAASSPQLFQHFIGVLAQRRWGVAQHGRVG